MVALYAGTKVFLTYLLMRDVFPAEELPMKRILQSLVREVGMEEYKRSAPS